jgi:phosphoglycerate dehydrogenase-like enzyme
MGNATFNSSNKCKVLFSGTGHFTSGFQYSKEAIQLIDKRNQIEVVCCERKDILREITDATVLVPLMSKITKHEMEHAPKLKLIMQFGVGLEGNNIIVASIA